MTQTASQVGQGKHLPRLRYAIRPELELLDRKQRRRYRLLSLLTISTALLDLLGILLLGGTVVILTGVAGATRSGQLPGVPGFALPWSSEQQPATAALVLGALAATLLIGKGIAVLALARITGKALARFSVDVSQKLLQRFLVQPLSTVLEFSAPEISQALTRGVNASVFTTLYQSMILRAELVLVSILGLALLWIDPVLTLLAGGYLLLASLLLHYLFGTRARSLIVERWEADLASQETVIDVAQGYREVVVNGHAAHFDEKFSSDRRRMMAAYSREQFHTQVPRHGMEIALVLGACFLTVFLWLTKDVEAAVSLLVVYLVAGSRVMPSLLRMHAARLAIMSARGDSENLQRAVTAMRDPEPETDDHTGFPAIRGDDSFEPEVRLDQVSYRYNHQLEPALQNVSLTLCPGQSVAVVGPSGAGKSTLADVMLGLLGPQRGTATIGGLAPRQALRVWPGCVAYIPQRVTLVRGSVRENVTLGRPCAGDHLVVAALQRANLYEFLLQSRDGLDTELGERGTRLSGGQQQRLGLARALFTNPRLLVMDEATSALDAESEQLITHTLAKLVDVTTLTIAHRLATVRNSDLVVFMESGRIRAKGDFAAVRSQVTQFDRQAQILGL
ncbi:MAG: ABC transporter ATP-binding protein/permease [Actinomycetia bacterium]|nr:ABC transporter ATP-binding protein/permease [Actinomycetes bacterium]